MDLVEVDPEDAPEGAGPAFWRGAVVGAALVAVAAFALTATFRETGYGGALEAAAGALAGLAAFGLAWWLARALGAALSALPRRARVGLAAAAAALVALRGFGFGFPDVLFYPAALLFLLAQACLAGAAWSALSGEWAVLTGRIRGRLGLAVALSLAVDLAGVAWIAWDGRDPFPTDYALRRAPPGGGPPSAPNPASPGPGEVVTLTYGAGGPRPELAEEADERSRSVDATQVLPDWEGFDAWVRERFWGFGPEAFPLNGRVWMPARGEHHPLVLIVHGNHSMVEYSDPGYAWLGELLASRGMIAVSVDENFVNGSWSGDFGGREMAARAWLLLEHLRLWRDWTATPGHRLQGRADLGRVALVGHSRGGEAAAIAAAFNRLPRFPDDATLHFDYGFGIRSVVAIAQIDRRYPRRVELEDVDFLALQGSYDADEPAFHGLRQWNRVAFSGSDYHFKAAVYLHRANHGQFNSVWGRYDAGPPWSWLLNTAPILPADDQRRVAAVFVSAFLEASLSGDDRYLELLRDPRRAARWLPEVALVSRFQDSRFRPLADFEEDLDVATGTAPGVRLAGTGLEVWREEPLRHRDDRLQGSSAVVVGWSGEEPAAYELHLRREAPHLRSGERLSFLVAASTERPPDVDAASDDGGVGDSEPGLAGLRLELVDARGRRADVAVAEHCDVAPPLRVRFLKVDSVNRDRYGADWEPVLQSCEVPLSAFARVDARSAVAIRFLFATGRPGVALLDAIGVQSPPL